MGGYMELVHTGHSSSSWTLVAGAMAAGPRMPFGGGGLALRGFDDENGGGGGGGWRLFWWRWGWG